MSLLESFLSLFGDTFKMTPCYESKQQIRAVSCDIQGDDGYDFEVVGESHYRTRIWSHIPPEHCKSDKFRLYFIFTLDAEKANPHDRFAVSVKLKGATVGHIPRELNKQYRKFAAKRDFIPIATCRGVIVGNKGKDYSIWLDLINIE